MRKGANAMRKASSSLNSLFLSSLQLSDFEGRADPLKVESREKPSCSPRQTCRSFPPQLRDSVPSFRPQTCPDPTILHLPPPSPRKPQEANAPRKGLLHAGRHAAIVSHLFPLSLTLTI